MNELDKRGISYFFGEINSGTSFPRIQLIQAMAAAKVILNLTLSNDLNMRFFEALALNKVVVANRVSDIEFLEEYSRNIFVGDHDAGSIAELIEVALSASPVSFEESIRTGHSLDYRLWEALSHLGIRVNKPDYGQAEILPMAQESNTSFYVEHKSSKLLGFSPLLSIRASDLLYLLKREGIVGFGEFLRYRCLSLVIWGGSRFARYFPAVRRLARSLRLLK
jgi:hypothetical protein